MARRKKEPDCFNAGILVTHVIRNIADAVEEPAQPQAALLKESAALARELGKTLNGLAKKKAEALARRASKMAKRKQKPKPLYGLRQEARQLKTMAARACRAVPLV